MHVGVLKLLILKCTLHLSDLCVELLKFLHYLITLIFLENKILPVEILGGL